MHYLPLFASLADRACLVVGGGHVGERRAALLLDAGAVVTIISPDVTSTLGDWARAGRITHIDSEFAGHSLDPYWLVVAATSDADVNARVAEQAHAAKILCNVVDVPDLCSFIMPAIVDRDPVTIAISSAGTSPVVARWIRRLIEDAVPPRIGRLAALAGRWRNRVREAIPAIDARRHFWEATLTGDVGRDMLAGREAAAERALDRALEDWRATGAANAASGEAWIVGAGPGDAELITLRGRRLLAAADVVLYDRLVNPDVLRLARREAELIPVGKQAGRPSITQDRINTLLVQHVAAGRKVCRLKGGDPMIFGRVAEELGALAEAGQPFQIVPGVSAMTGCAAYAGIPLTLRNEASAILIATGHTHEHVAADLSEFRKGQTLVLYMSVAHLAVVAGQLTSLGHPAGLPVTIVEHGTLDSQRVIRTTLGTLAETAARYEILSPALLFIGTTARFAERYGWFGPVTPATGDDGDSLAQVS